LIDCLRLARGMTYKAAVAGLNLGGGKSVIIGDNKIRNREPIFRAHGRHVKALAAATSRRRTSARRSATWSSSRRRPIM